MSREHISVASSGHTTKHYKVFGCSVHTDWAMIGIRLKTLGFDLCESVACVGECVCVFECVFVVDVDRLCFQLINPYCFNHWLVKGRLV